MWLNFLLSALGCYYYLYQSIEVVDFTMAVSTENRHSGYLYLDRLLLFIGSDNFLVSMLSTEHVLLNNQKAWAVILNIQPIKQHFEIVSNICMIVKL